MLPNFPKHLFTGVSAPDGTDPMKAKSKAKSGMGISNIPRLPDKPKEKKNKDGDTLGPNAPESSKNKDKKDGDKDSPDEEEKEEPKEVKKVPRYFPPRKLHNPFENAALEQEKFLQARKDALAKYSDISKDRYK